MVARQPRTPAYGLNDSPVGLLAWIAEKVRSITTGVLMDTHKRARPDHSFRRSRRRIAQPLVRPLFPLDGGILSIVTQPHTQDRLRHLLTLLLQCVPSSLSRPR